MATPEKHEPSALLGEVLDLSSGKSIKPGGEGPIPVYGSNGLIGGNDTALFDAGIIIGRVGAYCGSVMLSEQPFWASDNTIVARPRRPGRASLRYTFYALLDARLNQHAGGAAQPLLTQRDLKPIKIRYPDSATQERVAGILTAYDDLIENNTRRIRILEEMAQAIYREWFVDFRYPGHEDVPLIESDLGPIPLGWVSRPLGEAVNFRLAKPKVRPFAGEKRYIATADCDGLHDLGAGELMSFDSLPSRAQHEPIVGSVWFGRMAGYHKMLVFYPGALDREELVLSSGFACLEADEGWLSYLTCRIHSEGFEKLKASFATGATQVSLTDAGAKRMPFLIPEQGVIAQFETVVEPTIRLILTLRRSNGALARARDLLLPRLISGEIDVSGLEVPEVA